MDSRLYFLKEPLVLITILAFGLVYYFGRTKKVNHVIKPSKTDTCNVSYVDSDTTEWRKRYYEHLYVNTK